MDHGALGTLLIGLDAVRRDQEMAAGDGTPDRKPTPGRRTADWLRDLAVAATGRLRRAGQRPGGSLRRALTPPR